MGNTEGNSEVCTAFLLLFHWDTAFFLKFGIVSNYWCFFFSLRWLFFHIFSCCWGFSLNWRKQALRSNCSLKKCSTSISGMNRKKDPTVQTNAETQRERFIGKINPTHSDDEKWILLGRICFYFKDNLGVLKAEIVSIFKFYQLFVHRGIWIEMKFSMLCSCRNLIVNILFYSIFLACISCASWWILPDMFCCISVSKL